MDQERVIAGESNNAENNIVNIVHRLVTNWKWFVIGLALAIMSAYTYIRYKTPVYQVSATILIKDDKRGGGGLSELSAFEDLGLLKKNENIDNEIEILKSRSLMTLVAKDLRLNVRYLVEGTPVAEEKFADAPVYVRFLLGDSTIYGLKGEMVITPQSDKIFRLSDKEGVKKGDFIFGQTCSSEFGPMVVLATTDLRKDNYVGKEIRVVVTPLDVVVDEYRQEVKIDPVNKTSNVILLSLKDPVRTKGEAIINNLISQHNADAISDKNLVSHNTAEFINDRIKFITSELSDVEGEVEQFKMRNRLVDVESEAKLFLESGNESITNILEANTQKALAGYMYDYIQKRNAPGELIPSNLGLNDQSIAAMISEYNKLVLDRNRILRNSSEKNPVVESLDLQLEGIKKSIRESLNNYVSALEIKIKELNKQETGITSKIASVPKYEREYRIIQRQQQIKETLYLYLLQKREETNIALAVTVANAKVIDKAFSNNEPVAPKKKIVYLLAILAGLALPAIVLYIFDLLDNKVHGKRDIDRIGLPFLGDIPNTDSKQKIVVSRGDSSSVAEAFRLLRTNVDFLMSGSASKGKTIFLTSTLGKEGKSFIAVNLATSIAISGKRVLLVGMDVRAPKILEYLNLGDRAGLTNYISSADLDLRSVIIQQPIVENLDILPSGAIPPNPAELLMNARVKEMFEQVKQIYDYIIVDTAPIGAVTDTLLLSNYADTFVFVVRAYYLDKRLLSVAQDLYKEKRLPNMAVLINGTDKDKGYGYGYGYGYGGYGYGHEKPRPFWKRFLGIS
jgi:tyrosine-protein kinase Etk/Wzc